ncbi:protein transport protein SEC31 homolog B-like isoform X2 [Miscanthus floridulus]|uniref:protein transport protein SEC31 homolog B-like isoform X2 n=1 Tax=Miscanthus floridulus TaxID=154761 RepID=UPI0034581C4D
MAEVLASASMTASALAFGGSYDVSFLAAGTAPGSSNPGLLVYRTAAAYVDGVLPLVARIPSPAEFCRVAWSRPTEASCYSSALPTGLIAGGLKSGVVAVWDPREALLEPSDSGSDSSIIEDYFCPKDMLQQVHGTTPNLVAGGHDHENRATAVSDPHRNDNLMLQSEDGRSESGDGRWFSQFRVIDDYFSPDGPPQPPSLDSTSGDLTIPASSSASMVALMSCHSAGPVLGLSFSPTTPHFLASGGAKGTVLIWDLINPFAERIPHFQYNEDDNVQISDLSWNALKPNVITSASNVGVKILDISAKSSVIGKFSSMETCSAVEWCPTDKNTMVVASGNYCKYLDLNRSGMFGKWTSHCTSSVIPIPLWRYHGVHLRKKLC